MDHAWTFQPSNAHQQLLQIPGLANRMAALMGLAGSPMDVLLGGRGKESDGEDSYEADSESGVKNNHYIVHKYIVVYGGMRSI